MSEVTDSDCNVDQSHCFKWTDHQNHMLDVVRQLWEDNCMLDVTLSAAGERIQAHRIVLSACSPIFREVLSQASEGHPTVILTNISAEEIKSIVQFVYYGEVRVPMERIGSLLDAAKSLGICGLTEIDCLDEMYTNETAEENVKEESTEDKIQEKETCRTEEEHQDQPSSQNEEITEDQSVNKKRKRRRDLNKKDYNDDMLASAIDDLRAGQTLIETAAKHNIPRSTLYMRAKSLGIHLNASRNEYPAESMKAAINAVIGGLSLQNASEMFNIPKTVLWRRIQKEGYQILRSKISKSYCSDNREAAVKALERGENLTKVALEFNIPKTTLFRDKTRLVDQGKLPHTFWKKRKTEDEESKKIRLEEAVAACKDGKMSQAVASITYCIPKTTIWRRLQQDGKKSENCSKQKQCNAHSISGNEDKLKEGNNFTYYEVPITYIDENSIPEDSFLILTTGDMEGLNTNESRQIIVNSETGQQYIPCTISTYEENSNYSKTES